MASFRPHISLSNWLFFHWRRRLDGPTVPAGHSNYLTKPPASCCVILISSVGVCFFRSFSFTNLIASSYFLTATRWPWWVFRISLRLVCLWYEMTIGKQNISQGFVVWSIFYRFINHRIELEIRISFSSGTILSRRRMDFRRLVDFIFGIVICLSLILDRK